MARHRRFYRPRRRAQNLVWQPVFHTEQLTISSADANTRTSGLLTTEIHPGVGSDAFTDDHVLERIVGAMSHNGRALAGSLNFNGWFPMTIGAVKIPKGMSVAATGIDLLDNSEGDDYIYRMDTVCNAANNVDAIPNWHMVNQKSKRKFDAGDVIQFLYTLVHPATGSFLVDVSFNLRFLWRLKT